MPDLIAAASTFWLGHVSAAVIQTELVDPLNAQADDLADSGMISNDGSVTLASGWNTLNFTYQIVAGWVQLNLNANRTGATLTASSSGGLADTDVATASSPLVPGFNVYGRFVGANMSGACVLDSSGKWTITDAYPTSTISSGDTVRATFVYPAA